MVGRYLFALNELLNNFADQRTPSQVCRMGVSHLH